MRDRLSDGKFPCYDSRKIVNNVFETYHLWNVCQSGVPMHLRSALE